MTRTARLGLSLIALAAMVGTAFAAAPVADGGRKFTTSLTGAAECNNSGACHNAVYPGGAVRGQLAK